MVRLWYSLLHIDIRITGGKLTLGGCGPDHRNYSPDYNTVKDHTEYYRGKTTSYGAMERHESLKLCVCVFKTSVK